VFLSKGNKLFFSMFIGEHVNYSLSGNMSLVNGTCKGYTKSYSLSGEKINEYHRLLDRC